jgi:hypothetical protein
VRTVPAPRRRVLLRLAQRLPDDKLEPAIRLLRGLESEGDPLLDVLRQAPEDDEELSADEVAQLREAEEAHRRGESLSDEQVRRELGL